MSEITRERLMFEFGRQFDGINEKFSRSRFAFDVGILVFPISYYADPFNPSVNDYSLHCIVRFDVKKGEYLTVEHGDLKVDISTWNI